MTRTASHRATAARTATGRTRPHTAPLLRGGVLASCALWTGLAWTGLAGAAAAQDGRTADFVPPSAQGTGVTQKVGEQLPLDLEFTNTRGETVTLRDLFAEGQPLLLTFNYSDCPQLCSLQLNGLVQALRELEFTVGDDFQVATISIDPSEAPERAAMTQERYFGDYLRAEDTFTSKARERTTARAEQFADAAAAEVFDWHFLTGDEEAIRAAANAVGYAYNLDPNTGEYAHDAVVVVLTPDGTISRYLPSVVYEPRDLSLALVTASDGELGGIVQWTRMFCYRWDPEAGTYVRAAERIMLLGASGSALVLFVFLGLLWRREVKGAKDRGDDDQTPKDTGALPSGAAAR